MNEKVDRGTVETQKFHNREGRSPEDGGSVDSKLFGFREDTPLRVELRRLRVQRIHEALGSDRNSLEADCEGSPESLILVIFNHYTGVDFSETGINLAHEKFLGTDIPYKPDIADIRNLSYSNGEFDVVYRACVLYHIDGAERQKAALMN